MSAPQDPAPPKRKKDEGLDGCSYEEVEAFLLRLSPTRRRIFRQLLQEIAQGDFWTKKRAVQAIRLAASRKKIRHRAVRDRRRPGCQRDHHLSQREALQKDRDGGAPEIRTKKPTK